MPGSSLWLLPPPSHPLHAALPLLITQTSKHFNSPHRFIPHVTLTSEISPSAYGSRPQEWLDTLQLPSADEVEVRYEGLSSEDVFFRKLYIKCAKSRGLGYLAQVCRQNVEGGREGEEAKKWVEQWYNPHLSLLYHDCPVVNGPELSKVEEMARGLGIHVHGIGDLGSWKGGKVVLVSTEESIDQWNTVAERTL